MAAQPAEAVDATAQSAFAGHVVDQADVLEPAARRNLAERLDRFQRQTGHRLIVVTVATLGGKDVAAYTDALGNRWSVGRKTANHGVILLVAPHERRARISVANGLSDALPDAFCAAVMARDMVPAFADGRYQDGIEAGLAALMARLGDSGSRRRQERSQ